MAAEVDLAMGLDTMLARQVMFQQRLGDMGLPDGERVKRVGELALLQTGQQVDMMKALGHETHRPFQKPNWERARHEWVDQLKYLLAQAAVAGWEAEDLMRTFWSKSDVVEQRFEREQAVDLSAPVAVFDLDGVLVDYTHSMTDEDFAAGALAKSLPLERNINLVRKLRAKGVKIVLVTSRKIWRWPGIEAETERWLRTFDVPYDQLIFAYDKSAAVWRYNVVMAVEDSAKHALDYAQAGILTFFVASKDPDSVLPVHPLIMPSASLPVDVMLYYHKHKEVFGG